MMIYGKGTIHTLHSKTYTLPLNQNHHWLNSRIIRLYQTDDLKINIEFGASDFILQYLSVSYHDFQMITNISQNQCYYSCSDAEKFYQTNHQSNQSINLAGYPLTNCQVTTIIFDTSTLGMVIINIIKTTDPDIQTCISVHIQNIYRINSKGGLINKHGAITLTNLIM
jgi:hypothetical protein